MDQIELWQKNENFNQREIFCGKTITKQENIYGIS